MPFTGKQQHEWLTILETKSNFNQAINTVLVFKKIMLNKCYDKIKKIRFNMIFIIFINHLYNELY